MVDERPMSAPRSARGEDSADDLAEADRRTVRPGGLAADRDDVAVLEERRPRRCRRPRSGSRPPQDSSRNEPRWSTLGAAHGAADANRSPVRSEAPLTVRCASCWPGVQYIGANGGRDDDAAVRRVELELEREVERPRVGVGEVGQRRRVLRRRPATRAAASAASGVTHARHATWRTTCRGTGRAATYSHAWMSRADQSLSSTTPNTWSAKRRRGHRRARARTATPTTKPTSTSMSSRRDGPKTGASSCGGLALPARAHDVGAARRRPCRRGRGSRSAGASSSACSGVAVRAEDRADVRRRGARRSRSRRSRRPSTAGAARRRSSGQQRGARHVGARRRR